MVVGIPLENVALKTPGPRTPILPHVFDEFPNADLAFFLVRTTLHNVVWDHIRPTIYLTTSNNVIVGPGCFHDSCVVTGKTLPLPLIEPGVINRLPNVDDL